MRSQALGGLMLEISPETFSRISAAEEERFVGKLVTFLLENVPTMKGEPPQAMAAEVRRMIPMARGYNMISERAVTAFVLTAAQLGLDFVDRFAGVRQILFSSHTEDEKADLLEGFTLSLFKTLGRR